MQRYFDTDASSAFSEQDTTDLGLALIEIAVGYYEEMIEDLMYRDFPEITKTIQSSRSLRRIRQ